MPTVSIIVPNYNHARFLRQRIDSILAQTYQDFELILLDDCSTDDSAAILREYASHPRVTQLVFNETNSGSTFKQWNKGVRLARGEYVWIAESDDYAAPQFLGILVNVLDNDPNAVFAYCRSWRVDEENRPDGFADDYLSSFSADQWTKTFRMDGDAMCRTYFVRANPVPNASAVVFRRDLYEQAGGADELLRLCGDWKLWASMALHGRVAYRSEPLSYFRRHKATVRETMELSTERDFEFLRLHCWIAERADVSDAIREEICSQEAGHWIRMLISFRTSVAVKKNVLRDMWALDPRPMRRAARPVFEAVRLKLRLHWRALWSITAPADPPAHVCDRGKDIKKVAHRR